MHELFSKQKKPLPCSKYTAGETLKGNEKSDDALSHHGFGNLHETGDIGADHQIARLAAFN